MSNVRYHKTKSAEKRSTTDYKTVEQRIDIAIDEALEDMTKEHGKLRIVSVSLASIMIGRLEPYVTVIAESIYE